jgi:cellulose 1,4-beta-cellobiosidase
MGTLTSYRGVEQCSPPRYYIRHIPYLQQILSVSYSNFLITATMYRSLALASLSLFGAARAQQAGTVTSETHPKLSWKTCTGTGGTSCTTKSGSIVLDSNWRWTHVTSGYTNCYDGNSWNTTACPDGSSCTKNCAVDGADYSGKLNVIRSRSTY